MSTTPTEAAGDVRKRFGRKIEEAFEMAAGLAGSNIPPTDFYQQFLNRTVSAIDAPAGAVWLRTPQGFLQIACQVNLDGVGLENRRGGRQCHNELLRRVFTTQPPRPIMLAPNDRLDPGATPAGPPDPTGAGNAAVPAANLTDYVALFAPIVTPDRQPFGVLELFQEPKHDPRLYQMFLNYAFQMAGYASQYHQFTSTRASSGMEKTFTQVETFARLVHSTLNPTEVAYHVANEGRKLIECDRLCVGVRHARKKITVEAVSGADVVEKASTHVRRLRRLMEAVVAWGDTLTFKGTKDAGLPPQVSRTLDDYLNESQPKLLVVQPIRDERETKDKEKRTKPARSVLVMESFNPPELVEPMIQRLDIVGKHAAPALYNAAEMKRVPLKFLWWPLAKIQDGLGGKARAITIAAVVALAALTAAMILVPYPLRMDAKGEVQPVEIAKVYAPMEGVVRDIRAKPGDKLDPGFPAVRLYSESLEKQYNELVGKRSEALVNEESARKMLDAFRGKPEEELNIRAKQANAKLAIDSANKSIQSLEASWNMEPGRPGWYRATTPQFDSKLRRPVGASKWTVLDYDKRESLFGRTVRPNEELQRVGNLEGTWQVVLKIPQRNVGQIMKAFADPALHKVEDGTGKKYLDVDVLLASQTDTSYLGRLYQDDVAAEAVPNKNEHDENEPVVTAYVKLNAEGIPPEKRVPESQFVTGLEVRTRVRCGNHALGYSMFHGVWEWFYEKVVFFF